MTFYANHEMLKTIEFERDLDTRARRRAIEARKSARRQRGSGRFEAWRRAALRSVRPTTPPQPADRVAG